MTMVLATGCTAPSTPSPSVTPTSASSAPASDTAIPSPEATTWSAPPLPPIQLDTSPAGDVLTYFSDRGPRGEVALVSPDGKTKVLYELPEIVNPFVKPGSGYEWPTDAFVSTGRIDGQWAVFGITIVYSIHAGSQMIIQLEAVNMTTGAAHTVRPLLPSEQLTTLSITKWVVLDGAVYWSETSGDGKLNMIYFYRGPSNIYRFDLNSNQQTTLASNVQLNRPDGIVVADPSIVNGVVCWETTDGVLHSYAN